MVLFAVTVAGWAILPKGAGTNSGITALLWCNLTLMLGGLALEARRRPYSLHLMHLLALTLFMGVGAVLQYSSGTFPTAGPVAYLRNAVLPAALAITIWTFSYILSYEIAHRSMSPAGGAVTRFLNRPVPRFRVVALLALALVSLFYLASIGLSQTFVRGAATAAMAEHAGLRSWAPTAGGLGLAYYLFHQQLLRIFSPFALLAGVLLLVRDRGSRNPLLIALVAAVGVGTLLANNPFAAARLFFATVVIAFLAPLLLRRLKTGWGFVAITLMGITVLPSLHLTRMMEGFGEFLQVFSLASPLVYLAENRDVDSLGMLSLVQKWTDMNGHRWGLQTLGGLLFWFPRPFWPSKPIGTGGMVTDDMGFATNNWAAPIISEPLVDFGLPGVMPFAALIGILLARLDRAYWDGLTRGAALRVVDYVYPFWPGCVLFYTRGGWLSSTAFLFVCTVWVVPLGIGAARALRQAATDYRAAGSVARAGPEPPIAGLRDGSADGR